jgi:sialate O-acetylesterase
MLGFLFAAIAVYVAPQLEVAPVFSDHMVLQRDQAIILWGTSAAGAEVEVVWRGLHVSSTADDSGAWRLIMPPLPANSEGQVFRVNSGAQTVELKDVLIGDVWICAGQSNMEFPLARDRDAAVALEQSEQPQIRFFDAQYTATGSGGAWKPETLNGLAVDRFMRGSWTHCDARSLPYMSAVAYFFGHALQQELGVPVGLIDLAAGGTPTEAWIDVATLRAETQFEPGFRGLWFQNAMWGEWCNQRALQNLSLPISTMEIIPGDELGPNHAFKPGFMWQSAVAPFSDMSVRGVIWYQGESNAESPRRVEQHGVLFPMLIESWRRHWRRPELPFLFVQLPSMGRPDWPEFREQQRQFSRNFEKVGMAVSIDVGHATDVHPRIKKPVGERLAKLAMQVAFDHKRAGRGPKLQTVNREDDYVILNYQSSGALQSMAGREAKGFELVDHFQRVFPVKADWQGNQLHLPIPTDCDPRLVLYAWAPVPDYFLTDASGIPASPMRALVPYQQTLRGAATGFGQHGVGVSEAKFTLSLNQLNGTAASLQIEDSHFLFDAKGNHLATEGPLFGDQLRFLAIPPLQSGQRFELGLMRQDERVVITINGQEVAIGGLPEQQALGSIWLRPHRGTFQLYDWQVSGDVARIPQAMDGVMVFEGGQNGYHTFRIPAIVQAQNGDLLAFAEGRKHSSSDSGDIDLVQRRSTDQGLTWGAMQVVADNQKGVFGNPAPVVERQSGDVLLFGVRQEADCHESHIRSGERGTRTPYLLRSKDHGVTWSKAQSLLETADKPEWAWYATGPCHAIQLQHGPHAGRLVVPANFSLLKLGGSNEALGAHLLLSDDAGKTWRIGAVGASHLGDNFINASETAVAELSDGRLYLNTRDQHGSSKSTRAHTWSLDGGESLTGPFVEVSDLPAPVCQASLMPFGKQLLFSAPSHPSRRQRLALRSSSDGGATWKEALLIDPGPAAYSDLVHLGANSFGVLYEPNASRSIRFVPFQLALEDSTQK